MRAIEKRLRERLATVEKERDETKEKLDAFRHHYVCRMRWWIELLGQGKTPSLPWVIEDDAKLMAKVGSWWWA